MKKIYMLFSLLSGLLLSCAGTHTTNFYLLHIDQIPVETEPAPLKVGIQPFSTESVYSNYGIAYQNSPYEIQFYNYHQWAINPDEIINQTMLAYLKQAKKFEYVCQLPSSDKIDYRVTGSVLKFVEWNEGGQWFGWMELNVQIFNENTDRQIWNGQISKKIPAEKRNPVSVVKALSEAVKQAAEEIAAKIVEDEV